MTVVAKNCSRIFNWSDIECSTLLIFALAVDGQMVSISRPHKTILTSVYNVGVPRSFLTISHFFQSKQDSILL